MLEKYIPNNYLRAVAIFFIVYVAVKLVILIFKKALPKLTAKTKTDLDDKILQKISSPITILAILGGARFAIGEINLSENLAQTTEAVFMTFIILFAAYLVYQILDSLMMVGFEQFNKRSQRRKLNESLFQFFHSVLKVVFAITTFLIILSDWGVEIGPLLAGVGVAGIAIAFALQNTLSNIFGGISLLLDRSIHVGDLVKLSDGTSGKILEINLRSTRIRTFDNELVIVPNSKLSESNIQNVALPEPKVRVVVPFGVAYGSDIDKVKKIVLNEIKKIKNTLEKPEPSVKFLEMADSSLNFKAYFYVDNFDNRMSALDEANTRIYKALNKAGIEIPFPQLDVHLRKK